MITLELDAGDAEVLTEALQSYLSELHTEIAHTDTYDYREMLKERRAALRRVLATLEESLPAGLAP